MTWRLLAAYLGWLLAASALALILAILTAELLGLLGLVDRQSGTQQRVVEISSIAAFAVLALLPFLLRGRLLRSEDDETG